MGNSKLVKVAVKLPWVEGTWEADRSQQLAAWEMYVELVTRISVQPLGDDDGLLREAFNSLYALFGETRRVLREHGPGVAIPEKRGRLSFGAIAVDILNRALRPFLAKWHPLLKAHEAASRPPETSDRAHERAWSENANVRRELKALQATLTVYADLLAEACGIPPLHAA
jgi:hypothetical protein